MVSASIVWIWLTFAFVSRAQGLSRACEDQTSLLQLSRSILASESTGSKWAKTETKWVKTKKWDISAALRDEPSGAYMRLIDPVASAVRLSYTATNGADRKEQDVNASIPNERMRGGAWERVFAAEVDPVAGMHAIVLQDPPARRAIVAFRGLNLSPNEKDKNRDADQCAAKIIDGIKINDLPDVCSDFHEAELDYLTLGKTVVEHVQKLLPGYSILLTGHSLGAQVAVLLAASMKGGLKAVTFGLDTFTPALTRKYGLNESDIGALDATSMIALQNPCDPAYLHGKFSNGGLFGATVCAYEGAPAVKGCSECAAALRGKNTANGIPDQCLQSFMGAHVFKTYLNLVSSQGADNKTALPKCTPAPRPKSLLEEQSLKLLSEKAVL